MNFRFMISSRPVSPSSLSAEERRLRSQLHALLNSADGLLHGSLIEMARRCGKSSCRCACDDAARHRSLYLGQTAKGKSVLTYIPVALEPMVRLWTADFLRAADLLEALNVQARVRLASAKLKVSRAPAKSPKVANSKSAGSAPKAAKSPKASKPRTKSASS
jgi:hypothetical protein